MELVGGGPLVGRGGGIRIPPGCGRSAIVGRAAADGGGGRCALFGGGGCCEVGGGAR